MPLLGKTTGTYDEAAVQVAAGNEFLHQQTGHDCLARAGIVGEQEAQRLAGQHHVIDGGDLVR